MAFLLHGLPRFEDVGRDLLATAGGGTYAFFTGVRRDILSSLERHDDLVAFAGSEFPETKLQSDERISLFSDGTILWLSLAVEERAQRKEPNLPKS